MTMTKLRNKMIPARINREKGKDVAVTLHRGPMHSCVMTDFSYSRRREGA